MKEYYDLLKKVKLFHHIESIDIPSILEHLNAKVINPLKGDFIITTGNKVEHIGIVLEGQIHIVKEDIDGNRNILSTLFKGDFFGEALCCAGVLESPVSVIAETNSKVILLKYAYLFNPYPKIYQSHTRLMENMLKILAEKNIYLQTKITILSKKTIRKRILSYLETVSPIKEKSFTIPFNREELADFLCIDRSALSRELGHLKKDGLLDYKRNEFKLLYK